MSNEVLELNAPEPIRPVSADAAEKVAGNTVKISENDKQIIEQKAQQFWQSLKSMDLTDEGFQEHMQQAFNAGRAEIVQAANVTTKFTEGNFKKDFTSDAFVAINELRNIFDDLNPGDLNELYKPTSWFKKILPGSVNSKLQNYVRRYESAGSHLQKLTENVTMAREKIGKDVQELKQMQVKMLHSMSSLEKSSLFFQVLDRIVTEEIDQIRLEDPIRAQIMTDELLYNVRQNRMDVQKSLAMTINTHLTAGVLVKTGNDVMNGCSRVATYGMSALQQAVTLAMATKRQADTSKALQATSAVIDELMNKTGEQLKTHVKMTSDFAQNPMGGIESVKKMFENTTEAMRMLEEYRTTANATMETNNALLQEELGKQMNYVKTYTKAQAQSSAIMGEKNTEAVKAMETLLGNDAAAVKPKAAFDFTQDQTMSMSTGSARKPR